MQLDAFLNLPRATLSANVNLVLILRLRSCDGRKHQSVPELAESEMAALYTTETSACSQREEQGSSLSTCQGFCSDAYAAQSV